MEDLFVNILSSTFFAGVVIQILLARRNKTEKLTQKLKELYLLVEKARIQLFDRLEILRNNPTKIIDEIDMNTLHELDSIDKAYMYINLYFPLLLQTGDRLLNSNREINSLILNYSKGESIADKSEVINQYVKYLENIKQEIIDNKTILTKDNLIPQKYHKTK